MFKKFIFLLCFSIFIFAIGCSVKVTDHDPTENINYDQRYSYTDLQTLSRTMAEALAAHPPLSARKEKPVIIVYGILNRTTEHIDTKAITDTIRTILIQSNKFSFLHERQRENIERELAYQYESGNVDPNLRVEKARQVGAEYMLTGRLMSIEKTQPRQVRLRKRELAYYKLTMELTNLESGLIDWSEEYEIVREARKPFIGW
jgi:penicillin-binding protein activator